MNTFIRQHRPGHMQFINPTPWTRRSLRAPQVIAQRKAERARDGDE